MKKLIGITGMALSACATLPPVGGLYPPPPTGGPMATVALRLGGRASVNGIGIRPRAIVEDSRCAADVQCVWAGRLVVLTEIVSPGGAEELNLNLELGKPVQVYGGRLTLVAAQPPKLHAQQIPPSLYRLIFRFER